MPDPEVPALPMSFGFLSTYPPTQCGLATFTAALREQVAAAGFPAGVVRVVEHAGDRSDPSVVATMVHDQPGASELAVAALDRFAVAVIQHEFGIYAGADGDHVLEVLEQITTPSIVVLHTVLVSPTEHQRQVLEAVGRRADVVVTMTETARLRLLHHYDVDETKVVVIPHGAADAAPAPPRRRSTPPVMLTWGLIGPGKGIERVIDVLPSLRDLTPRPHYLVVGETHPRVYEREGERYRNSLEARAERLGVRDMVTFKGGYLDTASLRSLIVGADVAILPYDSREQVTSGVLIEAVAARRPVIATAFAHAKELLGSGAGIVVDHDDPPALSAAIRQVLCEPAITAAMAVRASQLAPELMWSAVAARYIDLGTRLVDPGRRDRTSANAPSADGASGSDATVDHGVGSVRPAASVVA
jgi:glycosyltransferase involved in cell wall biosynthesis